MKRIKAIFALLLCSPLLWTQAPRARCAELPPPSFTVEAPVFAPVSAGYSQPQAQAIVIKNTGTSVMTGLHVELTGSAFSLVEPEAPIWLFPGGVSRDYSLQPLPGLTEGTYSVTVTVTCREITVSADASFVVQPAGSQPGGGAYTEPTPGIPSSDAPQNLEELRASDPAQVSEISRFDSRSYSIVPPVKDQGATNLCWCYAPVTASEISIHRSGVDPSVTPDTLRLSPSLLARARHSRGPDPLGNTAGESTGESNFLYAPGDASLTPSLFSQWCAPALEGTGSALDPYLSSAYRLKTAVQVYSPGMSASDSIMAVKRAIVEYGAVTASYNNMRETKYYNPLAESGSGSSPHACTIIGWDDTIPKELFRPGSASQNGGWLMKNSYSTLPYFWLSYDNPINTSSWAFSYVPKETYDYNYFYDCKAGDFGMAASMKVTTGANIFTAEKGTEGSPEYLTAVQAAFQNGTDSRYEVSVYTDLTDPADPESGTLATPEPVVAGPFELPGYYTADLPEKIPLTPGSSFSVVVKVTGSKAPVLRLSLDPAPRSFRKNEHGWSKLNQAVRIKAFTVCRPSLPTPSVSIDYEAESLTGFVPGAAYLLDGKACTSQGGSLPIDPSWLGKTLSIIQKGDSHALEDSAAQSLPIPQRPAMPPVAGTDETFSGENDGTITGLTPAMEYRRAGDPVWTPCPDEILTGLQPGEYQVRFCATDHSFAGAPAAVTIQKGQAAVVPPDPPLGPQPDPTPVFPFRDVHETDYFYQAVSWAVEAGITTGTSPAAFSPHSPCTRAQMAVFLWRAAGCPEPLSARCAFTDVSAGSYYYRAVLWAVENRITKGVSKTAFAPNKPCTRGEMVVFLHRWAGAPEASGALPFTDVPETAYYRGAVLWAVQHSIVTGTTKTSFRPSSASTRGQMAAVLYRMHKG